MSGGPVVRYAVEGEVKPFGLVCSDPDLDTENKQNRIFEGRSIIALLPCEISYEDNGKMKTSLHIKTSNTAGLISCFDFH